MEDPERVVALLHELEQADAEKGALLDGLDRAASEVDALRKAATRLQDFEARLPAARERAMEERATAHYEVALAITKAAQAEEAFRRASTDKKREAELLMIRARDRLSAAKSRNEDAKAGVSALEAETEAAASEAREVKVKAQAVAKELRGRSRLTREAGAKPGRRLREIAEWGEAAHAALFVARGQVTAERDALIRQANELGSVTLGEPLSSASTAVVARRVEQALGRAVES